MILGIPARKIAAPSKNFEALVYTGDGATSRQINTQNLSGGGFVIITQFSPAGGASAGLYSENGSSVGNHLLSGSAALPDISFNSSGILLGVASSASLNISGNQYIAYVWPNDPDICSVVSFTGNATNRTVAHGLSTIPELVFCQDASGTSAPPFIRKSNPAQWLRLPGTTLPQTDTTYWQSTYPDATNVSIGTSSVVNASGVGFFLISLAPGCTRQLEYTGNGSPTGPIVSTGIGTPVAVISRNTTRSQPWNMVDQIRTPGFVGSEQVLSPGSAVYTLDAVSAVSGGYQLVTADNRWNESGRANLTIVAAPK